MLQAPRSRLEVSSGVALPIAALMGEVAAACEGPAAAMGERIAAALGATAAIPGLLSAELRAPRADCYARHTICADPAGRFTLLSLVWGPGQFSPPHAHATWCAYAVVENALTETLYDYDAQSGKAVRAGAAVREPGYCCFAQSGLEQIHRLGNAGGVPAVSIHVYGVESRRIGTHVNRLVDVAGQQG